MKELSFEKMREIHGGDNVDNAMCTLSSAAFAIGALTVETGFGFVIWGIGAIGVAYCNYRMVNPSPDFK